MPASVWSSKGIVGQAEVSISSGEDITTFRIIISISLENNPIYIILLLYVYFSFFSINCSLTDFSSPSII